ncbi:type II secretion system F family protein [Candidatus Woesearchaeota archaeon]|nr:type II secretion system F family protein [Candidatus Woesearchaeota archaeon]
MVKNVDKSAKKVHDKFSIKGRLNTFMKLRENVKRERASALREKIMKSGLDVRTSTATKIMFIMCIVVNALITIYAAFRFYDHWRFNFMALGALIIFCWIFIFAIVIFTMWLLFYLSLDIAIFHRRQKLEAVLPDFLQLVSSNIRAGMTLDQALWFAVRPRFGVLAKEIEEVAKRTFAGEGLENALLRFVGKYDSKTLERSINLLVEGVRAGGELGDLLNKISTNIQETELIRKEMSANVTSYVIFITFATVVAAPFLFGMAYQLILVIQDVFSKVDFSPGASSGVSIMITPGVISIDDFRTFAIASLIITSVFSSIIISVIKKGHAKASLKYIPMFAISSIVLFLLVIRLFTAVTGGFF